MNHRKKYMKTLALFVAVVLAGLIGYIAYKQYDVRYRDSISDRDKLQQQAEEQQKALKDAQAEIEKLKQQSEGTQTKQDQLEQKVTEDQSKQVSKPVPDKPKDLSISAGEINTYSGGVTKVVCGNDQGSGFLWHHSTGYVTITNDHVIAGNTWCNVFPANSSEQTAGGYQLDLATQSDWNPYTDVAVLKMSVLSASQSWSQPIESLNYGLSNLRQCPIKMQTGSPVVVIGYPAFGIQPMQLDGYNSSVSARQVTEGIVSGHDISQMTPIGTLPYPNYYVSAKIDSGNSGGVALSKDENGLCLLGIATWLSIGNYETQGLVQNIHNVTYSTR